MKLTDTHLVLLSRATQRDDGALDVPATLKNRKKVVDQLLAGKLIEEVPARGELPVWRRDDQAGSLALTVTDAGLKALRVEQADSKEKPAPQAKVKQPAARKKVAAKKPPEGKAAPRRAKGKREGSKQDRVIA